LEIRESTVLDDADRAFAVLHRLRGVGVCIALDDFGTGYSSLSNLRKFLFDKIKIDRSRRHTRHGGNRGRRETQEQLEHARTEASACY
jgi:EAL domain-containing protein (putative c-di-GMP-specific phosphodiesterase class I)